MKFALTNQTKYKKYGLRLFKSTLAFGRRCTQDLPQEAMVDTNKKKEYLRGNVDTQYKKKFKIHEPAFRVGDFYRFQQQKKHSGAHSRVATLIQPSFQKKKQNNNKKEQHFPSKYFVQSLVFLIVVRRCCAHAREAYSSFNFFYFYFLCFHPDGWHRTMGQSEVTALRTTVYFFFFFKGD